MITENDLLLLLTDVYKGLSFIDTSYCCFYVIIIFVSSWYVMTLKPNYGQDLQVSCG